MCRFFAIVKVKLRRYVCFRWYLVSHKSLASYKTWIKCLNENFGTVLCKCDAAVLTTGKILFAIGLQFELVEANIEFCVWKSTREMCRVCRKKGRKLYFPMKNAKNWRKIYAYAHSTWNDLWLKAIFIVMSLPWKKSPSKSQHQVFNLHWRRICCCCSRHIAFDIHQYWGVFEKYG